MHHDTFEKLAIFHSLTEVRDYFAALSRELAQTPREQRNHGMEIEFYLLERWVLTLLDQARLLFPLAIYKTEAPDFIVRSEHKAIGLEVTEATSPEYHIDLARGIYITETETISVADIMPAGNTPRKDKALIAKAVSLVADAMARKESRLASYHNKLDGLTQELLVYLNDDLPMEDYAPLAEALRSMFRSGKIANHFDGVSILLESNELLFHIESGGGYRVFPVQAHFSGWGLE
ncbi:MAG: hypothetical protein K0R63_616 [Rickettsiales bacterium]|jgi:hypothetical protein|nr:hypothetical protein [Rickettsiales bacterium]